MAKREKKRGGEAESSGDEPRNVQSIEFKANQWEAVARAAEQDGTPVGTWVRQAALQKAAKMGFWAPFSAPGPKKPLPHTGDNEVD